MLTLHGEERVLMVLRKHWFVMAPAVILFLVLILVPPIALTLLPLLAASFDPAVAEPVTNFLLSLYLMVLLILLLHVWAVYYLDMWIITSERIIDIEQHGLFSREVSEIPIARVQDVTLEVHGIIETFLKFGTIRIQTAGEREFVIRAVPRLYEAKEAILKYANITRRVEETNA